MSIDRLTRKAKEARAAVHAANQNPLKVDDTAYRVLLLARSEADAALAAAILEAADDRFIATCRAIVKGGTQDAN